MTDQNAKIDMPQPGGVPLDRPYPSVPVGEAIRRFWAKYATFSGRASRSEFWWWWLTNLAVVLVLELIGAAVTGFADSQSVVGGILITVWGLATIVPGLALAARRLHDANISALWLLILLVAGPGAIVILVMVLLPSNERGARFDSR